MKRHRDEIKPISEMNVTNLLDTAFILLMAFMLVTPTINHGIELELPRVTAQTIDTSETVTISIRKKPSPDSLDYIYFEGERVSLKQLGELLIEKKEAVPDIDVLIEADRGEEIDTLAKVFATVKSAGIEALGFATDPVVEIERRQ